ncbi:MAG TPA: hypothetical protein VK943_17070, partial [Arenibaculum sp.]|nr:hypothetical protein [Arenibaculum sp.]
MTPEFAHDSPFDPPPDSSLPVGWLRPAHDRARRALTALDEQRIRDALTNIAAMPDETLLDRAWRAYLEALAEMQRADFDRAEALLLQAHGAASISATPPADDNASPTNVAPRLAAAASEQLGVVLRRRE